MQEEVQKLPTTNEAGDASDEDTPSGDGDLPEGYRRKLRPRTSVAMIRRRRVVETPRHGGSTRRSIGTTAPQRPYLPYSGSRSGPARDLSREELDGLREEARLAKQSNFPGRERGPFVKPGEKPGFWPGQACCEGHMGGRRRFRNRGGK